MQQIAAVTLGIAELARSRRFYVEGFGWTPVFESDDVIFYQMNGFVLATWRTGALAGDMMRSDLMRPGAFALAHNVCDRDQVAPLLARLAANGGNLLRVPDEPAHGGFRGYVADPDAHAWEIAWNPAWPIDESGHVTFAAP